MPTEAEFDAKFKPQNYNILIVDDTPANLKMLVEYLEHYGFGARITRSGENALQRVQYDPPDLILLDVLMPGLDGFETCRRLKANAETRDIPIIFMTALASTEDKVKGFEAGAVD
jgi:CheY-like chemotaxis protein